MVKRLATQKVIYWQQTKALPWQWRGEIQSPNTFFRLRNTLQCVHISSIICISFIVQQKIRTLPTFLTQSS
jgi:hypothetical protein